VAGGGKGARSARWQVAQRAQAARCNTRQVFEHPAESVLTFRLERPIRVDVPDHGHDRDGGHYHDHR